MFTVFTPTKSGLVYQLVNRDRIAIGTAAFFGKKSLKAVCFALLSSVRLFKRLLGPNLNAFAG
jgi:hypothetical protein